MTATLDLSNDYLVWDFPETVELEIVQRSGQGQRVGIAKAKRRAITKSEVWANLGRYTRQDVRWHIPTVELPPGVVPKIADVIRSSDGRQWTALEVAHNKISQTYGMTCRDLVLVNSLVDRITIEQPEKVANAAGILEITWHPWVTDLPCRVQPDGSDVVDERGIRGKRTRYKIAIPRELDLTLEERIPWKGSYLDITGYVSSETLDSLPEIQAELKP